MVSTLYYRLFQESDLPQVLQLWEQDSGWGKITAETWLKWHMDTPYGPCIVMVVVDDLGGIGGQMVLTPTRAIVDGKEIGAVRTSAPILRKDLRRHSLNISHPFVGLYDTGGIEAIRQDHSVLYGIPDYSWLQFYRRLVRCAEESGDRLKWKLELAEYPCLELQISEETGSLTQELEKESEKSLSVRLVTTFGEEYRGLWQTAKESFSIKCGVVRTPEWLSYRNGGRLALEVRDRSNDRLLGYAAIKNQNGLLLDFLAREPHLVAPVLGAVTGKLKAEKDRLLAATGIKTLKVMETALFRPALRALNFKPVDFFFGFFCEALDRSLCASIAPENWYIMPGD